MTMMETGQHLARPPAPKPPVAKGSREFNYITPAGKRLNEYEAVTLYGQYQQDLYGIKGWFVKRPDGGNPWRDDSTRLRHHDWFAFRDPAKLWQRTQTSKSAEQERSIERVTEDVISRGDLKRMDPDWLENVVKRHYRVWSYVEYGLFRPFATAQREVLSDTLASAYVFESLDRLRHAQDIVVWLTEIETHLADFQRDDGKERWLSDPCYQPTRRIIEKLMFHQWDWAELAVAANLVIDPILTEVGCFQLIQGNGSYHGDLVSSYIVSTAERDRRWSLAWTEALVRMVTADDLLEAKQNREVLREWIEEWTPLALEAAHALRPVYEGVPRLQISFDEVMSKAQARQQFLLDRLGIGTGGER